MELKTRKELLAEVARADSAQVIDDYAAAMGFTDFTTHEVWETMVAGGREITELAIAEEFIAELDSAGMINS